MKDLGRWGTAAGLCLTVLATALPAGPGVGDEPANPWAYPKLIARKAFQRWWWEFKQRAFPLGERPHFQDRDARDDRDDATH